VKVMNQYEVMYVIDTQLEDTLRQDLVARFNALIASNGGTVDRVDEWGKRRLAYSINYKTEGYYVLMYVTAPPALPRELERNLQISDSVLRYLVTRFEGALPPKRELLKPFVPAALRAEAAPTGIAAAPAAAPAEAVEVEAVEVEAVEAEAVEVEAVEAEEKTEPVAEV
jgi:small subunit ribosomal protein S6